MKSTLLKMVILSIFLLVWGGLAANPTNPVVVSGAVTFNESPGYLEVSSNSSRAIVNWDSFSLSINDKTVFSLPDSSSAILNKVPLVNPSSIMGKVTSNGQVYLINPSGIVFGETAFVDVGTFLASTLDVSDAEFLAGQEMTFSGSSSGTIRNDGYISAFEGDVFLLSSHVVNSGEVSASVGVAGLAAGSRLLLRPEASEKIMIEPQQGSFSGTGIDQVGIVSSAAAEVKADGNLYALAIHQTGLIDCVGFGTIEGRVVLKADNGEARLDGSAELLARNENGSGGHIEILGDRVSLLGSSTVSATGELDGGFLAIGGAMDPSVYSAQFTTTGEDVEMEANAGYFGDGGQVAIFATDTTDCSGSISATGGLAGGDGGSVEISGQATLIFNAQVDTSALFGATGLLTIDPDNIFISQPLTAPVGESEAITTLTIQDLQKSIRRNNLIVTTRSDQAGKGKITLASPAHIVSENGNSLTIHADGDLNIEAPLSLFDQSSEGNQAYLRLVSGKKISVREPIELKSTNMLYMEAKEQVDLLRTDESLGRFFVQTVNGKTNICIKP